MTLLRADYNIMKECSSYLNQYEGPPFIKWIPNSAADDRTILKIKLRHRKNHSTFDDYFNYALSKKGLRQKALFIKNDPENNSSPYFIIPPNGYQTLYSSMVHDSKELEEKLFKPLLTLNCVETIKSLFKEVLELHYTDTDPSQAIVQNREVILYNVPYVYAIKQGQADFDTIKQVIFEEQVANDYGQ